MLASMSQIRRCRSAMSSFWSKAVSAKDSISSEILRLSFERSETLTKVSERALWASECSRRKMANL